MTDQELINLAGAFRDIPLEHRRGAWRRWATAQVSTYHPPLRVEADKLGIMLCCPWGMVLIDMVGSAERAYPFCDGLPGPKHLDEAVLFCSGNTVYLSEDAMPLIRVFMHLMDARKLTDEQIHRIMVPEDYAEATV